MQNLSYTTSEPSKYQIATAVLPTPGWYTFCIICEGEKKSLLLFNPDISANSEPFPDSLTFSVREEQLPKNVRENLSYYPLFYQQGHGPFTLDAFQYRTVACLFEKIISQINTSYLYKDQLIANLILQLFHFAIKHFTLANSCNR
jgi:hypothetical protein